MRTMAILLLIVLATCRVKGDTSLRRRLKSTSLNLVEEAEAEKNFYRFHNAKKCDSTRYLEGSTFTDCCACTCSSYGKGKGHKHGKYCDCDSECSCDPKEGKGTKGTGGKSGKVSKVDKDDDDDSKAKGKGKGSKSKGSKSKGSKGKGKGSKGWKSKGSKSKRSESKYRSVASLVSSPEASPRYSLTGDDDDDDIKGSDDDNDGKGKSSKGKGGSGKSGKGDDDDDGKGESGKGKGKGGSGKGLDDDNGKGKGGPGKGDDDDGDGDDDDDSKGKGKGKGGSGQGDDDDDDGKGKCGSCKGGDDDGGKGNGSGKGGSGKSDDDGDLDGDDLDDDAGDHHHDGGHDDDDSNGDGDGDDDDADDDDNNVPSTSPPEHKLLPTFPSTTLNKGLIDPCLQPIFEEIVPNALDPSFIYKPDDNNKYITHICKNANHQTGLVDESGNKLSTPIYGYGDSSGVCSWPGMTFEVQSFTNVTVRWENTLPIEEYIITSRDGMSVVDTSLHWAYSLPGYESYTIPENGTPTVTHVHGMHSDSPFDGISEFFFSPGFKITGPEWLNKDYIYDNSQPATTSWYHDHTLGITRLNVYAGLVGFYIVRDEEDTGKFDNSLSLPAFPYEAAFAIQDRMFKDNGELFYPAFPGDPSYEDFIIGEGAVLPDDQFPDGGPTALAEFFGDVMLVNGKMWPKMEVEPRNYRLRLLNGCDSRFIFIEFFKVGLDDTELPTEEPKPIPFTVIADDHALAYTPKTMTTLMVEPGARYDVVVNFANFDGHRVIMKNSGPDSPFTGDEAAFNPTRVGSFCRTDRIMAFNVIEPFNDSVEDNFGMSNIFSSSDIPEPTFKRRVALFEGLDQFGRLQPLLGTVDPATDVDGNPILWPDTEPYQLAGLAGKQMQGTIGLHEQVTENPRLDTTEEWEIWNLSGDAHPIHLHLVHFDIIARNEIIWDSSTIDLVSDADSATGDGTYLVRQPIVQHHGELGEGFLVANPTKGGSIGTEDWYFVDGPKDTVVVMPGTVTTIKAKFDKAGSHVWHCHILSHEDYAMMREFNVRP